jgi:hypothetical protein
MSSRDTIASRGAISSSAETFPGSGRFEGTTDIVLMDMERPVKPHPSVRGERMSSVSLDHLVLSKGPVIADIA